MLACSMRRSESGARREPAQVIGHLAGGVGDVQQSGHQGAQALVGDAGCGQQGGAQGAGQGHDPRIAKPQGWGPPPVRVNGRVRDPLKGWARKDGALASLFCDVQLLSMRRLMARALSCSSARLGRRALQPRSRGALMTVSIRIARPSLRYCLIRECL